MEPTIMHFRGLRVWGFTIFEYLGFGYSSCNTSFGQVDDYWVLGPLGLEFSQSFCGCYVLHLQCMKVVFFPNLACASNGRGS